MKKRTKVLLGVGATLLATCGVKAIYDKVTNKPVEPTETIEETSDEITESENE